MFIARRLQKFVFVIVFIFFFKGAAATRWQQLIVASLKAQLYAGGPKPQMLLSETRLGQEAGLKNC